MRTVKLGMIVLLLGCLVTSASADTHYFVNNVTWSDWMTASNWSPAQIPAEGDTACIGGGRHAALSGVQAPLAYTYVGYSGSTTYSPGYLRINSGGNLTTNYCYLAYVGQSYGYISLNDGATFTVNNDLFLKYNEGTGTATFYHNGGTLNVNSNTYMGRKGKAVFNQDGGTNNQAALYVGYSNYTSYGENSDVAYYNITGGTLNASNAVVVGGTLDARGHLKMGNDTGATGTINGAGNLVVKNGTYADGLGIVQGFGNINLTGALTNNGKVIADGWGGENTSDRTLSMTSFSSIETVEANQVAGAGWYAQNCGKLILPSLTVAGGASTAFFGEDADGAQNLVNSMKLDFDGVTGGDVSIALLALDHSEAAGIPSGLDIIGLWDVDGSCFTFGSGSVNLRIKYDEALATTLGLAEADLKFFHQVGGVWVDITTSLDTANNLITADGVDSFSQFAVGVPEPATMGLLSMGLLVVLAKRRQK